MKVIIHIEKEVSDKYDLADLYFKVLNSLASTAQMQGVESQDFSMLLTSSSFTFMDERFRYPTLRDLKDHFERLCESYWSHKGL